MKLRQYNCIIVIHHVALYVFVSAYRTLSPTPKSAFLGISFLFLLLSSLPRSKTISTPLHLCISTLVRLFPLLIRYTLFPEEFPVSTFMDLSTAVLATDT